ncbi:hypothetical protein C7M84_000219 [Penaeus vannamei]|uniref:Uncharacterized protein n=1 Tax=Penaeus vannamei TaxID=6689 RepID=A0A3R7MMR4_PENVA|nr:hypothetical protein C7M84_000219 [Penaeus vannamei]
MLQESNFIRVQLTSFGCHGDAYLTGLEDAHYHRQVNETTYPPSPILVRPPTARAPARAPVAVPFGAALREAAGFSHVGRAVGLPRGRAGEAPPARAGGGEARVGHAIQQVVCGAPAVVLAHAPPGDTRSGWKLAASCTGLVSREAGREVGLEDGRDEPREGPREGELHPPFDDREGFQAGGCGAAPGTRGRRLYSAIPEAHARTHLREDNRRSTGRPTCSASGAQRLSSIWETRIARQQPGAGASLCVGAKTQRMLTLTVWHLDGTNASQAMPTVPVPAKSALIELQSALQNTRGRSLQVALDADVVRGQLPDALDAARRPEGRRRRHRARGERPLGRWGVGPTSEVLEAQLGRLATQAGPERLWQRWAVLVSSAEGDHPSSHLRHSIAPPSFLAAADSTSESLPTPAEPSDAALHAQASPLLPGRRLECNLPSRLPPSPSPLFPRPPPRPPSTTFSSSASFTNIYCIITDFTYLRKLLRSIAALPS